MEKRSLAVVLSAVALCIYIALIMYLFFVVVHVDLVSNFITAIIFQMFGFIVLAYFIIGGILIKPLKIGYFVPLLMVTVVYSIVLDVLSLALVANMPRFLFFFINLFLLFIYSVVAIPMYIMGRKEKEES